VGGLLVGEAILPPTDDRALSEEGGIAGVRGSFLHLWDEGPLLAFVMITPEPRHIEQQASGGLEINMLDIADVALRSGVNAFSNETALAGGLPTYKVGIVDVMVDNPAKICDTVHADLLKGEC